MIGKSRASPPETIADGAVVGREKMLIVSSDAAGRIVAQSAQNKLK